MSDQQRACESCRSPLAPDQHYCLSCGEHSGAKAPLLGELLQRLALRKGPTSPDPAAAPAPASPPAATGPTPGAGTVPAALAAEEPIRGGGPRLPQPRVSALLVLVFLGFGVLLGSVAGSGQGTLAAAVSPRLKLVLPEAKATASNTSSSSGSTHGESEVEAPEAESQPTPSPAKESQAKTTAAPSSEGAKEESGGSGDGSTQAPIKTLPHIRHVFLIMLSDEPYAAVFGPESKARYLAHTLEGKGELLIHYDAVAHEELANEIALISGQGPSAQTAANCPVYEDFTSTGVAAGQQLLGEGCVYPATVSTLADELATRHQRWRAYIQGIDEPGTQQPACARPSLGASDPSSQQTQPTGPYATFRNPFVYFHSIVDSSSCAADDVGFSHLKEDLARSSSTPSFSYIALDRCHDANPTPCTAGAPAGPATADAPLELLVPQIMSSQAYKQGGLIVVTVDEAPSSGEFADSSSCCGQPSFPNLPAASTSSSFGHGGGAVGALLISPFVKAATTSQEPYDHFSLLRTFEDLFELPHLGYSALPAVKALQPSLFIEKAKG